MDGSEYVESYRFWDVVTLWARERLQHEVVVARHLAAGFLREGLPVHSQDPRWLSGAAGQVELRGQPHVGFASRPGQAPVVIRASALEHLRAIAAGEEPDRQRLHEEYINRPEFLAWVAREGLAPARFWTGLVQSGAP